MHRGIATFTLDTGQCPKWLFERMVRLGREMTRVLVEEYGPDEFIRRISDPVWFQSLGTVLAFDWNASGLTTILTAALKEAIRGQEQDFGIFICGGKGKTSRKTPDEITGWGKRLALPEPAVNNLVYNSRMAAKVDSALVQDEFQIYHHSFFFSRNGSWSVVQQGMNAAEGSARRYHWFSENINDLVREPPRQISTGSCDSCIGKTCSESADKNTKIDSVLKSAWSWSKLWCGGEPHAGIFSEMSSPKVLNLVARESEKTRALSTELVRQGYCSLMKDIELLRKYSSPLSQMLSIRSGGEQLTLLKLKDTEFRSHPVVMEDFSKSRYLDKILARVVAEEPENYEKLLATEGVGPKTICALSLVGEVIYGAKPSYEDPARYSFAHGGKDATPYPVDRKTYDQTIVMLGRAVERARISPWDKQKAIGRLWERRNNI